MKKSCYSKLVPERFSDKRFTATVRAFSSKIGAFFNGEQKGPLTQKELDLVESKIYSVAFGLPDSNFDQRKYWGCGEVEIPEAVRKFLSLDGDKRRRAELSLLIKGDGGLTRIKVDIDGNIVSFDVRAGKNLTATIQARNDFGEMSMISLKDRNALPLFNWLVEVGELISSSNSTQINGLPRSEI